jgi:hypothetical protein
MISQGTRYSQEYTFPLTKTWKFHSRMIQMMRDHIEQEAGTQDPAEMEDSTDDEELDSMDVEEEQAEFIARVSS